MKPSGQGTFVFVAILALTGCLGITTPANASIIVNIDQVGSNVVANETGTLDLAALTSLGNGDLQPANLWPDIAGLAFGPGGPNALYSGLVGPSSFGSSAEEFASSETGSLSGIEGSVSQVYVPVGYVSGTLLTGTDTFDDTTIAGLGLTDGTYTWTWGSAATADSFVINVGVAPVSSVPEPITLSLFGAGLAGVGFIRRRRKTGKQD